MATKLRKMATRAVALEWLIYMADVLKVREVGGNNRGPLVEAIQGADTLPGTVYAWCQSTQNAAWRLATGGRLVRYRGKYRIVGGTMLAGGTASVGQFAAWARMRGYLVTRPYRGDHFCLQLGSDSWPDHVGMVEHVISLGPFGFLCRTVEGNTGSDIADGDGLYRKTRFLNKRTIFVRVPGVQINPHRPPKKG